MIFFIHPKISLFIGLQLSFYIFFMFIIHFLALKMHKVPRRGFRDTRLWAGTVLDTGILLNSDDLVSYLLFNEGFVKSFHSNTNARFWCIFKKQTMFKGSYFLYLCMLYASKPCHKAPQKVIRRGLSEADKKQTLMML